MMKMARDRLARLRANGVTGELLGMLTGGGARRDEAWLAIKLGRAMQAARREGGGAVARVWDEQWQTVYKLADAVCSRHMEGYAAAAAEGGGFAEPIVSRL